MTHQRMSEPEALRWIQQTAMNRRKNPVAIAAQVIAEFDQTTMRTAS